VTQGRIRFSRRHQLLLDQLRQFPLGVHDDGPDALEMAVQVGRRPVIEPGRNVISCITMPW